MIDDIKFLLDRDAGFSYFPSRGTLVVMFYRDFRAFMDLHLGKAKETTKTESNWKMIGLTLCFMKPWYNVECSLSPSEIAEYLEEQAETKELKDDEMRYEAEWDILNESKDD